MGCFIVTLISIQVHDQPVRAYSCMQILSIHILCRILKISYSYNAIQFEYILLPTMSTAIVANIQHQYYWDKTNGVIVHNCTQI